MLSTIAAFGISLLSRVPPSPSQRPIHIRHLSQFDALTEFAQLSVLLRRPLQLGLEIPHDGSVLQERQL
jgi:hypothetical protein